MRVLIAIMSCERDRVYHNLVRNTWLRDNPVDYKFFLGNQEQPTSDEVSLGVSDGVNSIPKIRKIIEYAVQNNYDYLFKCDVDTFVCVPRLLRSGFEDHDFVGCGGPYGVSGYWLSRKAMTLLYEKGTDVFGIRDEDRWVSQNLKRLDIDAFQDGRYHSLTNEGPAVDNDIITAHWYSTDIPHRLNCQRFICFSERLALFNLYYVNSNSLK